MISININGKDFTYYDNENKIIDYFIENSGDCFFKNENKTFYYKNCKLLQDCCGHKEGEFVSIFKIDFETNKITVYEDYDYEDDEADYRSQVFSVGVSPAKSIQRSKFVNIIPTSELGKRYVQKCSKAIYYADREEYTNPILNFTIEGEERKSIKKLVIFLDKHVVAGYSDGINIMQFPIINFKKEVLV